jgi:hypothetical protein
MDQAADRSDIVVMGESVGGVSAISTLHGQLAADPNASVMIALHRPADPASYLPQMPENAIAYDGAIDLVAPIDALAEKILSRTGRSLMQAPAGP